MESLSSPPLAIVNLGYISYHNMHGNIETEDHDHHDDPKKDAFCSTNSYSSRNGDTTTPSTSAHSIQELKELKLLKEMKLLNLLKKSRDNIKCESDSCTASTASISTSASTFAPVPGALEFSLSSTFDEDEVDVDIISSRISPIKASPGSIRSNYLSCQSIETESYNDIFFQDCDDDLSMESDIFCSDDVSFGSDIYCHDDISLEAEEGVVESELSLYYRDVDDFEEHVTFMTERLGNSVSVEKSEVEEALVSIEHECKLLLFL